MAELVGSFAASHAPLIAREWATLTDETRGIVIASYRELGKRLMWARPDILVMVTTDHWVNFFLNNLPSFCVGVGPEHDGPPEPFLKPHFPHETLPGHEQFGRHLVDTAFAEGFDPAISYRAKLDHGVCIPLWQMALKDIPAIVPVFINELEEPMPTIKRCFDWGKLLAKAIESFPGDQRIGVFGTGGLSHSIGEPTMGQLDVPFDQRCLEMFGGADEAEITDTLEDWLPRTGNGAHEVRSWVIAHAAMGGQGFDLIHYAPLFEVYAGCGFAQWRSAA